MKMRALASGKPSRIAACCMNTSYSPCETMGTKGVWVGAIARISMGRSFVGRVMVMRCAPDASAA